MKMRICISLSEDDKREIDEWLQTLFPDGVDAYDDQLISAIYNELRNSDSFSYEYDITENWESMAQFLQTRTGDCEEFTQLFFHAIQAAYEQMPARNQPELSILAGTVGPWGFMNQAIVWCWFQLQMNSILLI